MMTGEEGVDAITFVVKEGYNHQTPLIIDPGLVYSTFLGGTSLDEGVDIAVDDIGNTYITGRTTSTNFPITAGAFDTTYNGGTDAFVTKLNAAGSALIYSTYVGGDRNDQGLGISVDDTGHAYITGVTLSRDFPTTAGAFDIFANGGIDAFVTKLNAAGSALLYSTYLGGTGNDQGLGISVDDTGDAYITGFTESANFPTTAGAFDTTYNGNRDAFVTKLNATGSALLYSTYLGGAAGDQGNGISVDDTGNAYITGLTSSVDFPTTAGAFDTTYNGSTDAFVTKLNAAGGALLYSTYLGGTDLDQGRGIAVDDTGNAYITGLTSSNDFPTTAGAFDTTYNGSTDAFVTKLNAAGNTLLYSTYLGGTDLDQGDGMTVDGTGNAYITGFTESANFPTTAGAFDTTYNGNRDAFVTKLNAAGSALLYSTYVGGTDLDQGRGIDVDGLGNAYITGITNSADFPTTAGAFDTTYNGSTDAFVTKLNTIPDPTIACSDDISVANDPGLCGATVNYPPPVVNDECPGGFTVVCNPASGSFFSVGDTMVTCMVTDPCGGFAECSFTITVNDMEEPTITCPGDISQDNDPGECGAFVIFPNPVVMDNCPGVTFECTPSSGSFFSVGTTEVSCVATDASGNESAPCTFEITVNDTEPPTITCPADIIVGVEPGETGIVVNYPDPIVNDNCPGVMSSCFPASGSFFPLGTTEVTCTAEDFAGNRADCTFEIRVEEVVRNPLQVDVVLSQDVQVVYHTTVEVEGRLCQPRTNPVSPQPFQNDTPLECINVQKVYDWIVFCTEVQRRVISSS